MFQKLFIFVFFSWVLTGYLHGEKIEAKFDVSYGVLGKIGTAEAVLKKNSKSYSIDIKLKATGLARLLSRGREEQHTSTGHMLKGVMISDVYRVTKSYGNVKVIKEYTIDHTHKKIHKIYKKYKEDKLLRQEVHDLTFYTTNDLLTLYFNLDVVIKDKTSPHTYAFDAVGAERQKGKVSIEIPNQKQLIKYKKELDTDSSWYATAIIHQKIFSSKEGRLMLAVAHDGITNMAVLKDVILFGDIRAVRIK